MAGAAASVGALAYLRHRLVFFRTEVNDTIPLERVRLRKRGPYPVHFLLLHGYGANRRQLLQLAEVLAAAGGSVFVMDLPGRGNHDGPASPRRGAPTVNMRTPNETADALAVVRYLEDKFDVFPERLVLVGHSLGGGVALDVARQLRPAATIWLAGLERRIQPGEIPHLLLLTARFEIPALRRAADRMHRQAGGGAGRAEFLAVHSSLPFHSPVQQAIVEWANRAVPGARLALPPLFNEQLLAATLASLVFLAALYVWLAGLAARLVIAEPLGEVVPETRMSLWSPLHLGGYALLASLAVVSALSLLRLLGWPPPLRFLGLSEVGYLASVLLFATLWLAPALRHQPWVRSGVETFLRISAAVVLAFYVIAVGGGFLTWQLFDLWPTPARWARMAGLVLLLFLYVLGEELLVRTFSQRGSPLTAFLVWRLALLAAVGYGVVVLRSGEALLLLLLASFLLLSLVEYFFAAVAWRALESAYANAVLRTLLLSWFFAVFFPLG